MIDTEVNYRITKEQCAKNIFGVCSSCGGKLEPLETVDNSRNPTFWSGCPECCKFDNGTDPKVYETAKLLWENGYRHYSHIQDKSSDSEETKKYNRNSQISGTCGLVKDVLRIYGSI